VSAQLAKLPAEMKRVLRRREVSPSDSETFTHLFAGSAPSVTLITREGAKMLTMRSDKPSAVEFQRQLVAMSEAVDSHGGYIRGQENASPELQAKAQEFTRRVAGLIAAEEREARSDAFAVLKGRPRQLR
jgi:prophage antirepressor-like protein